ncbi:MAG TPA: ADP-ribosylglycohydrolase family protein [Acidimicrobiia bacterium]|nr:ADP-ribosylglycohydrolase family protein [Acidimicrobiia bacterium]
MTSSRGTPPDRRAAPGSAPAIRDAIAGCLLGGAVGDAVGAVVEFDSLADIRRRYGPDGLTGFPSDAGFITDDTQMTLFTAEGLIRAHSRFERRHFEYAVDELWAAYRRWLGTQQESPAGNGVEPGDGEACPGLGAEPALRHRRGPGNTCLSALSGGEPGSVELPVNDSKGCGGVMRVAPVGLVAARPCGLGIASAALTHGHASGYLSAGAGAEIIARLSGGEGLRAATEAAIEAVMPWPGHEETVAALRAALALADREPVPTPEAVATLGEGWVGEEALAIAVYCAVSGGSFEAAVLAAANHSGDSDSTAAITGNLLGAAGGRAVVPEAWIAAVVERPVIERIAAELSACFA